MLVGMRKQVANELNFTVINKNTDLLQMLYIQYVLSLV